MFIQTHSAKCFGMFVKIKIVVQFMTYEFEKKKFYQVKLILFSMLTFNLGI